MGRQLFLHHYLPAHIGSCLVTGALFEFIFNAEPAEEEGSRATGPNTGPQRHVTARERYAGQSMVGLWVATGVVLTLALAAWYFFLPLTYGYPGLSVEEVRLRKMIGYDLHFAK
jgi:dolichyl-phosphate-mannose-protein mannosyltransferase